MKILGITGPTGAGKSRLSEYLSQKGFPVIDADEVYHALLIPPSACLDALRGAFGEAIFFADGSLNRPALSDIVFHDSDKLALLNKTVLGFVLDEIRAQLRVLETEGHALVAIDAPTLIESGFHHECDAVISVLSDRELRIGRIMARDKISKERAIARIDAQPSDDFYREHSTHVLENSDSPTSFNENIEQLLQTL